MTSKQYETLTDEIKKLRKDVKELREASQWPRIQYVPVPQYVPQHVPNYPQPSYPWWGNGTVVFSPANTVTTHTSGNVLANATTTTYQISTPTT